MARAAAAAVAGAGALLASVPTAGAAERWHEVRTPHFTVVTNAGEGEGREAGRQFEQVRRVFSRLLPWAKLDGGRPMVIFLLRRERDLRELAPRYWEDGRDGTVGLYVGGPGTDFVALQKGVRLRDELGTNPYFYAYWGYATRVLTSTFPSRVPPWLQRGLADVLANTIVRGDDVHVGRVVTHHLEELARSSSIRLEELLAADWDSPRVRDDSARRSFDAHAWAFVHFLMFADRGAHGRELGRFAALLLQGVPPDVARREALADLPALEGTFEQYKTRRLYSYVAVEADLDLREKDFPVRELSPAEAAGLRATFHVAMGREAEARALVAEIREADPESPHAHEIEALLLDEAGAEDEARTAYQRAADAGSRSYWVHYRLARLLGGEDAPEPVQARRARALRRAIEVNDAHAWSHASLARALSASAPGEEAVAAASRAVELEPQEVAHRLALIQALWKAERAEEARGVAEAALRVAEGDDLRGEVEKWIRFLDARLAPEPAPAAAGAPAVVDVEAVERLCEDEGEATACVVAAETYLKDGGEGGERAARLLDRSCELGEMFGCARLAGLHLEGRGVPRDAAAASALATRACDGGAPAGCGILATVLLQRGRPDDVPRARELLVTACDGAVEQACAILAELDRSSR